MSDYMFPEQRYYPKRAYVYCEPDARDLISARLDVLREINLAEHRSDRIDYIGGILKPPYYGNMFDTDLLDHTINKDGILEIVVKANCHTVADITFWSFLANALHCKVDTRFVKREYGVSIDDSPDDMELAAMTFTPDNLDPDNWNIALQDMLYDLKKLNPTERCGKCISDMYRYDLNTATLCRNCRHMCEHSTQIVTRKRNQFRPKYRG